MKGSTDLIGKNKDVAPPIGAVSFWRAFESVALARKISGGRPFRGGWRTKLVLERELEHHDGAREPGLLSALAERLQLNYRREFYGYDVIFHRDEIRYYGQAVRGHWIAPGDISVVLEHENDPETSQHEVYKLSLLAVPLKVLVTYPDSYGHVGEVLESYLEVLSASPVPWIGTFLVIFGLPRRGSPADWIAYVYDQNAVTFNFLEPSP